MPAEERPAITPEAALRIRAVQLWLCDLGRAFPHAVALTPDGAFNVRCPVNRRHAFLVVLGDDGVPMVCCPTCSPQSETRARFIAALDARMPVPGGWGGQVRTSVPVTPWVRQPEGAPAIALRQHSDGRTDWLADPERWQEVDAWLRT
jgi:hypothetical protein